jgi:hypothetical protein
MSLRVTREDTKIMCFSLHLNKKLLKGKEPTRGEIEKETNRLTACKSS